MAALSSLLRRGRFRGVPGSGPTKRRLFFQAIRTRDLLIQTMLPHLKHSHWGSLW